MRHHHVAGDRVFVDYAGHTVEVVDAETGEVRHTQLTTTVIYADAVGKEEQDIAVRMWG
jgi:hypothetical protein